MSKIYKYIYVTAKAEGFIREADYREIIDEYSQGGWRFITAIPTNSNSHWKIKEFDLVFEKED